MLFIIILFFIILYINIKRTTKYGLLISPSLAMTIVLVFSVFLPSLLFWDSLSDGFFVILYVSMASLCVFQLFINDSSLMRELLLREKKYRLNMLVIVFFSLIYIFSLLIEIATMIQSYGSLSAVLSRHRLSEYLTEGIKSGSFSQIALLVPTVAYYIWIGSLINSKKYLFSFLLLLITVFYYILTANTRLPIIMPLVAYFTYIGLVNFSRILSRFGVLFVLGSIFLISVFSFFANLLRHGISDFEGNVLLSMHEQNINQLKYPLWIDKLHSVIESNQLDFDFGYTWVFIPLMNFIPRGFWPEKPLTSTSNILSEKVYGIVVGDGSPITTFTIWGEGYWQLGILGVFLSTFIFFFCYLLVLKLYTKFIGTEMYSIFILVNWIPFIRAEQPIFHVITSILSLAVLVLFSYVVDTIVRGKSNYARS